MIRRIFAFWVFSLGLAVAVAAQDSTPVDTKKWERVAAQAEAAIEASAATSTERFLQLREDIVAFRSGFDTERGRNAAKIDALRAQIASLGEPPAEGAAAEAPEIAAKRDELNMELNSLLAPVQRAEASFLRADSFVARIDVVTREKETQRLLSARPTPLNPLYWQEAMRDLRGTLTALIEESRKARVDARAMMMGDKLPISVALALIGSVLLLRGRRWSAGIVGWLRRHSDRGFGVWQFVVSLLRVILPLGGIILLLTAFVTLGLLGPRLTELAQLLGALAAMMLGFRWLSERVFDRDEDLALLPLSREDRRKGRFHVAILTFVSVVSGLVIGTLETGDTHPATLPIVATPFFAIMSFALFRLGQILRGYQDTTGVEGTPEDGMRSTSLSRFVRGLGLGAMIVSCLSPLLLIAGYYDLAASVFRPYVLTLALLGLVFALQRFLADIYGAITGRGAEARDTLMPVLFGLILIIVALPLLALIWGARLTDLSEIWARFSQGFSIGNSRISPTDFLAFAIIFAVGYMLTRLSQGALRSNVLPKTRMDIGAQNAIVSGLGYVGIFLAALAAITGAGIDLSSLAIVAGALSVGIGFGLQNIVSNFVSGIILLIERPISEGDWIEVTGGQMGYVRDISVRSTRIETFDKTDVIVPNADLVSGTVTNYTRGNKVGRLIVPVGVAYGTDTRRVEQILTEIAEAQPLVVATPPMSVLFIGFGADSLDFEIRCFLRDVNWMMKVKSDMNHEIAARFVDEGIEIPFAQRDLWLRNPDALHAKEVPGGEA